MGVQVFDESTPWVDGVIVLPADGTGWVQLWSQSYAAIRVDFMPMLNTDTVDHVVRIKLSDGQTDHHLGAVTVLAGAGMGTVANYDAIPDICDPDLGGIIVPKGWILWVCLPVALAAGKELPVSAHGGII